ncbi:MAG: hypothetical protein R6U17_07630, partial [Thermoplasmata archaeon]
SRWSGDIPEGEVYNDELTVFMDGNKTVTAHFVRQEFTLNITVDGEGTTDPTPGNNTFEYEDEVNLTATPAEGWRFSHWTGDVPEGEEYDDELTMIMAQNNTLTAHFEELLFVLEDLVLEVESTEGKDTLEVTITVSASNAGLLEGFIDVVVDDAVVYTLDIPAEGSAEHTFTHTFDEPGTYEIEFGELTETVVVEESFPLWIFPVIGIVIVLVLLVVYLVKNKGAPESTLSDEEEEDVITEEEVEL